MAVDLLPLVKAEMKGMGNYGSAPPILQRETEAIVRVLNRQLIAISRDIDTQRAALDEIVKESCADYAVVAETVTGHAIRLGRVEARLAPKYGGVHQPDWPKGAADE